MSNKNYDNEKKQTSFTPFRYACKSQTYTILKYAIPIPVKYISMK